MRLDGLPRRHVVLCVFCIEGMAHEIGIDQELRMVHVFLLEGSAIKVCLADVVDGRIGLLIDSSRHDRLKLLP